MAEDANADSAPVRFRVPWTATLAQLAPVLAIAAAFRSVGGLAAAVGLLAGNLARRGLGLELTEGQAIVRGGAVVPVRWSAVTAIRRGSWWRGGLMLRTAAGVTLWAPAPSSWWGGPATQEQLDLVERWWMAHRRRPESS